MWHEARARIAALAAPPPEAGLREAAREFEAYVRKNPFLGGAEQHLAERREAFRVLGLLASPADPPSEPVTAGPTCSTCHHPEALHHDDGCDFVGDGLECVCVPAPADPDMEERLREDLYEAMVEAGYNAGWFTRHEAEPVAARLIAQRWRR